MKIHILGRNALNCALYLEFNDNLHFFATLQEICVKKLLATEDYMYSFVIGKKLQISTTLAPLDKSARTIQFELDIQNQSKD